jgi:hypothetical protein
MINSIYSGGKYMQVQGGNPNPVSIYNTQAQFNSNGPQSFTGHLRYNANNQCMEVFDGSAWQRMDTSAAQVGLTIEAESLLDWAREKRQEEVNLRMRMEQHPGLKDAYEKFKIMDALTLEEEHGKKA